MAAQTSYVQKPAIGNPGDIADNGPQNINSYYNGEAADLPLGVGVVEGANDGEAILPANNAGVLAGVVVNTAARDNSDLTTGSYAPNDATPVMRAGRVIVFPEVAVKPTDKVYMRFAPSVNTPALVQKGAFRNDPDTNAAVDSAVLVKGCSWRSSAAAGAPAILEVDAAAAHT